MRKNFFKISINIERFEGDFIPGQTSEIEQNLYISTEKEILELANELNIFTTNFNIKK